MAETVDATPQDRTTFTKHAHEFHRRNAYAWANARVGIDLTTQLDPDFILGLEVSCP
jgi:CO dehydrogenase maturation factor